LVGILADMSVMFFRHLGIRDDYTAAKMWKHGVIHKTGSS